MDALAIVHNRREHVKTIVIWIIMRTEGLSRPPEARPNHHLLRRLEHRHVVPEFTGVRQNNVYSRIYQGADDSHGGTAEFWMLYSTPA